MAEKDMAAKAFFGRPDIVADICNCIIFNGKKRVRPEDVSELSAEFFDGPQDERNRSLPPESLRIGDTFLHITLILLTLRTFKFNLEEMNLICVRISGRKGSARSPI